MRFLKPKQRVVIIAVRAGCPYEVSAESHEVVLKTASSNEKAFYEALDRRLAGLEQFLFLGKKLRQVSIRAGKRKRKEQC